MFYLQGLAQEDRKNPVETIAGGHEASIEYISEQIATKHGVSYSHDDVEDVLRLEADYLYRIGAVGERVDPLEVRTNDGALRCLPEPVRGPGSGAFCVPGLRLGQCGT